MQILIILPGTQTSDANRTQIEVSYRPNPGTELKSDRTDFPLDRGQGKRDFEVGDGRKHFDNHELLEGEIARVY